MYKLCTNHWSNDEEMKIAMFAPAPAQRPLIPSSISKVKFSSNFQLETILESQSIDPGVIDVEGFKVPLMNMIERNPALPALNGKDIEGGAASSVPAFLKRARSKIARSKSMSFLQRF